MCMRPHLAWPVSRLGAWGGGSGFLSSYKQKLNVGREERSAFPCLVESTAASWEKLESL